MDSQEKIYESRLKTVFVIFVIFYGLLLVAQFYRQVIKHGYYLAMANSQHFLAQELPAHRGKIYASSVYQNEPFLLAGNQKLFSLNLVPRQIKDKQKTAQDLAPLVEMRPEDIFADIDNNKPYIPPIKKNLDYNTAQKVLALKLDGVYLAPEDRRFYPQESFLAHVLGYVDYEGKGNYGLEQFYDQELKGDAGFLTSEKDVFGGYASVGQGSNAQNGKDLYLTIEMPVQYKAEEIIKEANEQNGAAAGQIIVINPKTGKIIAMAQSPNFNPENYSEEAKTKGVDAFTNASVSKLYEPGSIFKSITMATALENKAVEPATKMDLAASIDVQGYTIWNSDQKSHGVLDMAGILQWSDNVGIVHVEQLIGKDVFYKFLLEKFRLNLPLGIDLPNEAYYQPSALSLRDIEAATMAFGQGIAVSPLQIISAYASIANKGMMVRPYLVDKKVDADGKEEATKPQEIGRVISEDTAKKLTDMLVSVVDTSYRNSIHIDGYQIAGKTGTAQVPSPDGGYYTDKTVQSFVGYFPADNPQFVVLVKLDYPAKSQWAEYSTGPAFRELVQFLVNYYQIPKQ